MECSDITSRSLGFRAPSSHFMNTQNQSLQNFSFNHSRTDEYVQLKGMFNRCNIGSINVVLK